MTNQEIHELAQKIAATHTMHMIRAGLRGMLNEVSDSKVFEVMQSDGYKAWKKAAEIRFLFYEADRGNNG